MSELDGELIKLLRGPNYEENFSGFYHKSMTWAGFDDNILFNVLVARTCPLPCKGYRTWDDNDWHMVCETRALSVLQTLGADVGIDTEIYNRVYEKATRWRYTMRQVLVDLKSVLETYIENAENAADDITNDEAKYYAGKIYGLEIALEEVQDLIDELPHTEEI